MDKIIKLAENSKAGYTLQYNHHLIYYESVEDHLQQVAHLNVIEETPPEIWEEIKRTQTLYCLQWYPDTPVGSCILIDCDVERLLDRALS